MMLPLLLALAAAPLATMTRAAEPDQTMSSPCLWSLLYVNGSVGPGGTSQQQCLDAVGGGPIIDTFGCVDPHADNARNELFNLTAAGELVVQSDLTNGCVVAAPCPGQTSGLCVSSCGAASSKWRQHRAASGDGTAVTLSPADEPTSCLTFEGNLTSKLHLDTCAAGSASQLFTWGSAAPPAPPPLPVDLRIDLAAFDPLLPYEGLGALSAGADAALLFDYEETVRDHILDLLFLPHYPGGASLQILKVEIPGDVQSTCGSESSHEHFKGDLSYERGYEYKLMHEARKRNPDIRIYALEWSVPGWVGGTNASIHDAAADYSAANRKYTIDWLRGARDRWNVTTVDFLGFWNEPGRLAPVEYVMAMRADLDAAGFEGTKLVALDSGSGGASLYVQAMVNSTELQKALHAFGFHGGAGDVAGASWLPTYKRLDPVTRPRLWASESGNLPCSMSGAMQWGQTHLQNWLTLNFTATVRWSLIWSAYPGTICNGAGLLRADKPWSGLLQEAAPNLAASAHITWFTQPGMFQLPVGSGSSVWGTASAVTWVNKEGSEFTTVIEALDDKSQQAQVVRLKPGRGDGAPLMAAAATLRLFASHLDPIALAKAGVDCEDCRPGPLMTRQPDLTAAADGSFTLTVQPGFMYTLTTLPAPSMSGLRSASDLPTGSPIFPLPLVTSFKDDEIDSIPRFFNNYEGSFSIAKPDGPDSRSALKQWVFRPPLVWHFTDDEPLAIVAPGYANYEISSDVRVDQTNASNPLKSYVSICGRMTKLYGGFGPTPTGYCLELRASTPPSPPKPTPAKDRVRVTKCMDGSGGGGGSGSLLARQQWDIGPDKSIRSRSGGCLTLPAASVEPAKCGRSPLPPCVQIPNASPLTLTTCGKPLLATQKWETALQDQAGKWIQFMGGDAPSSPCIEVNMASVHAGDKSPAVDTWQCVQNSFDNLLWTPNASTAQLISGAAPSERKMCLEAPATRSSPPPPPPPVSNATQPMWRLVAHASYRFDGINQAGSGSTEVVLGTGPLTLTGFGSDWHSIKLSMNGSRISGAIDGKPVIAVDDQSFDHGLAGIGSGWNVAWFQNTTIVPLGSSAPAGAALTLVDTNTGLTSLNSSSVGSERLSESQWLGVKIRIAEQGMLTAVARFRTAGSTQLHNVSVFAVDAQTRTTALVASASVSMATASSTNSVLDSFGFMWSQLSVPVALQPGDFVLASVETPMGDPFYVRGVNGPCAGNSDGHDGSAPWMLPLLGETVTLLGAARSVGPTDGHWDGKGTSLGQEWDVATQSDQSQHAYGPVNLALTRKPDDTTAML
jgi:hypothetical protein